MVVNITRDSPDEQLSPDEIRRIREGLRLTQVEAGELLGGGPRAFTKYEGGIIAPSAAIANLLRLLDAQPTGLSVLTGRKSVAIEADSNTPLEITADHVGALSARKLAMLVQRLLSAEAQSGDLPMDGIHSAATITAPNDGDDAVISWKDGPERTAFVPRRLTHYQVKAISVTVTNVKTEVAPRGVLRPMIKDIVEGGGSFVLVTSQARVRQGSKKIEDSIRQAIQDAGVSIQDEQVSVMSPEHLASWANRRRPVAAWVLSQTQPGLVGPFHDWAHWAARPEHETSPRFDGDERLSHIYRTVRQAVTRPQGVLRVSGPSGVGKSRLVMEALGPDSVEETSNIGLNAIVLYTLLPETTSAAVFRTTQALADAGVRAVIVADRCDQETHQKLVGMTVRMASRLSLITIDHEMPRNRPPRTIPGTIIIGPASTGTVSEIARTASNSLSGADLERVIRFSGGVPKIARMIAAAWPSDRSLAAATNEAISEQLLLGHNSPNPDLILTSGMLLSLFGSIGYQSPLDAEIDVICQIPGAPTAREFRAAIDELLQRGVAQRRGRWVTLQPPPIAVPLAIKLWRQLGEKDRAWILTELPSEKLRERAAFQLAILNREPVAAEIVRALCRLNGPLATPEALMRPGATQILSHLAEIDPEAIAMLLDFALRGLGTNDLRQIDDEARRGLVSALEKITWREESFEQGAHLLLRLGCAASEDPKNNAASQFEGLFAPLGENTEAGPGARLRVLDEALQSDDPVQQRMVIEALLAGANISGNQGIAAPGHHGSGAEVQTGIPKFVKDSWDYIEACMDRLAEAVAKDNAASAKAKAGLGQHFGRMIAYGLLDKVEALIDKGITSSGAYWPEALGSIGDVLGHDVATLSDETIERIGGLVQKLTPTTLGSRVRFLVSEMPWDYPVAEQLDFAERERRQIADVEALLVEMLAEPAALLGFLPQLSRGNQRMSQHFGRALAIFTPHPAAWVEPIIKSYADAPPQEANFGLLGGFICGLEARRPDIVDTYKALAETSEVLAPTLPFICARVGITPTDVALVIRSLQKGFLAAQDIVIWSAGGVLKALPSEIAASLFDVLFGLDARAFSVGLDLIAIYVQGDHVRLEQLRPQLRLIAEQSGKLTRGSRGHLDEVHFAELMRWVLAKGKADKDAAAIALSLAKQIASNPERDEDDLVKPLLPVLLRDFAEIVWPILGQAIANDRRMAWRLEYLLGDCHSFGRKTPVLLDLPTDFLFAWCHAHPAVAPAFVAGLLPLMAERSEGEPDAGFDWQVLRMLDEFGERDDVLRAIGRKLHSVGWSGSIADSCGMYLEPLAALETHKIGAVRLWAKKIRLGFAGLIEEARNQN